MPEEIRWNPQKIAAFWSTWEESPAMQNRHFSRQRGAALLKWTAKHVTITEPVLDLGCGPGHLLNLLLNKRIRSAGADVSPRSISIVNERFSSVPCFLGATRLTSDTLPFEPDMFGTVFLLETIEHLLKDSIDAYLKSIRATLKKDGCLVITTPNRENLSENMITCTECGCSFHRTQHISSFDRHSLATRVVNAGFSVVTCRGVMLPPEMRVWFAARKSRGPQQRNCPECKSPVVFRKSAGSRVKDILGELSHLVCIARRP